ncbi:MAG: hypothetical protein QOD62_2653, partial [Actinomycetota bacterium]|nr:hypothetical protein [Actinomycetota bacterium]
DVPAPVSVSSDAHPGLEVSERPEVAPVP